MKRIIALSLTFFMVLMCITACNETEGGESSSVAESSGINANSSENASSEISSHTSSDTSEPDVEELNIIYYKFEIPYFNSNVPEKGASCVDNNGTGIDEYLLERDDASDDIYFAVGLLTSEGASLEALTEMGFIEAPKAVKSISWKVMPMNDSYTLPLDYVGYINPSAFDALCKNQAFGVEIVWLNTSVIKYGSSVVCDVDSLENIRYYEGEYKAATNMMVYTSGTHEIYSSGMEEYLSENDVADDVYFAVGISINGSYDGRDWVGFADDLPHMFGFVKDPNAKLNLEITEDGETFNIPFDVVGYVNKSAFENMQANTEFGIEITWLNQEYFG